MIESILIKNFRSIEECEISLSKVNDTNCTILLGKNGTGKTSLLKAISLLNPDTNYSYKQDCNQRARKDRLPIQVIFKISPRAVEHLRERFVHVGIPKSLVKSLEIEKFTHEVKITPTNVYSSMGFIYISKKTNLDQYWFSTESNKILQKPASNNDVKEIISLSNSENRDSTTIKLSHRKLEEIIEMELETELKKIVPECIYWENSKRYLINEPIDLNEFKLDPSISIPLHNIFKICGISDIVSTIEDIVDDYQEKAQLRNQLSNGITQYVNTAWPEHPVNFIVEIDNMQCSVLVEDKDDLLPKYRMDQRSDGFQQFMSILLSLSTTSDAPKIILMDEPEVHLHPSGIRHLRDELFSIAKQNTLIVSTHSIYMIDKLNLNRHVKVYKEKSFTKLKAINNNNPYEEELIYEALGTSIYEHIHPNMILFEGKTDLDIFRNITNKFFKDIEPLNIGYLSADGVEKIPFYAKFFDGKFVKGFVMTDSDIDGRKIKKHLISDNNSFDNTNVFEINDIVQIKADATLEDLYPKEFIELTLNEKFGASVVLDHDIPFIKQIEKINKELKGRIDIKLLKAILCQKLLNDIEFESTEILSKKLATLVGFVFSAHKCFKGISGTIVKMEDVKMVS